MTPAASRGAGEAAPVDEAELDRLHIELRLLRERVHRLEIELRAVAPVVAALKAARFWDAAPYDVWPGPEWVAADRTDVERLFAALAGVDHWRPWQITLERRPAE
ncbi:hypothetical protein [Pseudonocardia asaccharolytica]|uniref:Uncharacterized protein n=1 Tax=Pseudonocardia asaccharolytica DSM 44247 = NBRC 16224 TaxID=1123024 RepID=A0A511D1R1_9PSEU|nr:hypothetical protein [Pseudonocardia asaccharolytica]GEL18715.1 hypothetical protein PA7_25520 [Pseudonocardia asaccharolytica DSM 44247 = NBRC 16224]